MAIRTFNSVGGFSVGENPETIILPNGDITTDFATFTSNVDAGNVRTDHLLYANGVPWDFQLPAGTEGQIQYYHNNGDFGASANLVFDPITNILTVIGNVAANNLSTTGNVVATGNLSGNNGSLSGNLSVTGNTNVTGNISGNNGSLGGNLSVTGNATVTGNTAITGNVSANNASFSNLAVSGNVTGNLAVIGNISGNNESLAGNLTATGNVTANKLYGNLVGNINIGATDKTIAFTKGSNLYYSSNLQFDYTSNVLTLQGNLFTTNANLGNLATSNYFHGVFDATSSSQPNIHTVGTLDYLDVSTTITASDVETGNLSVSGRVVTHLTPSTDNTYDLGSSTSYWRNVYAGSNVFLGSTDAYIRAIGSVLYTPAQYVNNGISAATVTSRGDAFLEGDVTVSGNLTVGGTTTYINVSNLDVKDPLISLGGSGNGANLTHYDGKDRGLILRNRTSDDQFVQNQAFIWSTTGNEFRAFANVTDITGEVVQGDIYANIHANVFKGNVQGTILTASQTNITTVGTLTNLDVAGTLTVDTHASINSLEASGLQYPLVDGTQRQVLSTDGAGSLYWATIDTYRLANGTSNVTVHGPGPDHSSDPGGNVSISVKGTSNVIVISETLTTIDEDLTVTGTTNTGDLVIGDTAMGAATVTTTSIVQHDIIGLPVANFRAVEFFIKGEEGVTPKYSVATISAVHDSDGTVEWSTYGGVHAGASTGTFDVTYDGVNGLVVLKVTPSSSNQTVWTVQYRTI